MVAEQSFEQLSSDAVNKRRALSVSAALNIAKSVLSQHSFHIIGEVSELNQKPGYKAVYFTIKDESSSLPCLMWMNRYKSAGVPLRLGARVEVVGKFTIFAPKGRMNFDVSSLKLAGEGDLRAQVAQRALMLRNEGLMDPARKRHPIDFPQRIGLVTSPRGAAVHDVLRTLRRRYPLAKILFAGVPVEGKNAAQDLIAGLKAVIDGGAEEVLLVRGGGSFEDLMPFNDESLARFISSSTVPIITGIGHEPDTSIADMVADVRASTPTAAAETVSPDKSDLKEQLNAFASRMTTVFLHRIQRSIDYVNSYASRPLFRDQNYLLSNDMQFIDLYSNKLDDHVRHFGEADHRTLDHLCDRLSWVLPKTLKDQSQKIDRFSSELIKQTQKHFDQLSYRISLNDLSICNAGKVLLEPYKSAASLLTARLNDLSPLTALERGWSITKERSGALIRSIEQVKPADELSIQVRDGLIECRVIDTCRKTLEPIE